MSHLHARIKREMAVAYATAHPEVRYLDIGIALGYRGTTAKSMVGLFMQEAGYERPQGAGSPAFDQRALQRTSKLDSRKDEIRAMLRKNLSYPQMAKELGCDPSLIAEYCRRNYNVQRGKGWRKDFVKAADEQIVAAAQAHPDWSIRKLAESLGYSRKCESFRLRYHKLVTK
ncbi:MAG TPA: helix-turn-helix domain-containing protein [Candidatus Angelobacter sp.]|nr:helix-turn-helix domain-containing protein [Candidatus Angelobacter sp.]